MQLLIAIFSSITSGFGSVCFKKATVLSKAGPWVNMLVGFSLLFFVGWGAIALQWARAPWEAFSYASFGAFFVYVGIQFIINPIQEVVFKVEKLSALQPYGNIGKMVAILFGFFLLGEKNIVTLIVAIFALICMMLYASGGKFHRLSHGITLFIVSQVLGGIRLGVAALFLSSSIVLDVPLTGFELAIYQCIIITAAVFFGLLVTGHFSDMKLNEKKYYRFRLGGRVVSDTGWIFGLTLMAQIGIVTSTILSLITMVTTLIIGYYILGDKPEKKDVLFALFIVILISIGYFFRDITI